MRLGLQIIIFWVVNNISLWSFISLIWNILFIFYWFVLFWLLLIVCGLTIVSLWHQHPLTERELLNIICGEEISWEGQYIHCVSLQMKNSFTVIQLLYNLTLYSSFLSFYPYIIKYILKILFYISIYNYHTLLAPSVFYTFYWFLKFFFSLLMGSFNMNCSMHVSNTLYNNSIRCLLQCFNLLLQLYYILLKL